VVCLYFLISTIKKFIYIDSTNNIKRRLNELRDGLVKSTKPYILFKLSEYVAVETEQKQES